MKLTRRNFIGSALVAALATSTALTGDLAMAAPAKPTPSATFDVSDASVATLQAAMQSGKTSSQALVRAYLARIKALDKSGPRVNSVIEVNPDALMIARTLDAERKAGKVRGPMHGIPVLIKDNIATADKMQTTAGSLALVGSRPNRDAFIVAKLREAGAVIIGKTNLSEWANFRSTRSTSGWSSRGGLTKNPHALDRNTSGSSSGSGAAAAAGFATVTIGTETDGSIVSPANANGIVGFKPTLGLVSRSGIIPIAASQDTAGPMTRTVADAAALLTAISGTDPKDGATAEANTQMQDYTKFLDKDGLKGKRIGVVRNQFGGRNDLASAVVEKALDVLRAQGAVLVDLSQLPGSGRYGATELEVLQFEFKAGVASYLAEYTPNSPIKSLADVMAFNEKNRDKVMPYFQQELIVQSVAKGGLDSKEYRDALANNIKFSREEGIDKALNDNKLDALVAPSGSPSWLTDFIRGDFSGGGFSQAAAVAGYPHITVPAGFVEGLPVGISFVAGAWSEPTLFAMAYAYEQASKAWRMPKFAKTVNQKG
ncbi:MAG: amidase [Rhodocyclaceae bacterium]|nr:amidase [Rhodocyclaceae bacterium]